MKQNLSLEYLSKALEGQEFEAPDIDQLKQVRSEGVWIDFKDGALLSDRRKAARMLRKYVAGFANSDGGLLLVGVSDGDIDKGVPREVTGISDSLKSSPTEWAADVLQEMAPSMSPRPKHHLVTHPNGQVLVVAVPRSDELVTCREDAQVVYYFRFDHETLAAPQYLATDMILGRRNRPTLRIVEIPQVEADSDEHRIKLEVQVSLVVENAGLVQARNLAAGIVIWACQPRLHTADPYAPAAPAPHRLLEYVQVEAVKNQPNFQVLSAISRIHAPKECATVLHPFSSTRILHVGPVTFPARDDAAHVRAGLFLLADGMPPMWHQLSFTVESHPRGEATTVLHIDCSRTPTKNPTVSWQSP